MASTKRPSERKRQPSSRSSVQAKRPAQKRKDHVETKRALYRNSPEYRERVKEASREAYRKSNPKGPNPLAGRESLGTPQYKEVAPVGGGESFVGEAYTINKTAEALGMSHLGFKRWVSDGLVPEPVFVDVVYGYKQYMAWEVDAMIIPLSDHYDVYDYFHSTHTDTIDQVWRAVNKVRQERGVYGDSAG